MRSRVSPLLFPPSTLMACYLWKPVFKWPGNGFSRALPGDTRCRSARLSFQLDKVELFFFLIPSLRLKVIFAPSSVCLSVSHIVGMCHAPTCLETYAAELIERFSAGERGDHMIYLSRGRWSSQIPPLMKAEKRTIEMLAKLIIRLNYEWEANSHLSATCVFVQLSVTAVHVHIPVMLY